MRRLPNSLAGLRFRLILPALGILVLSIGALTVYSTYQLNERIAAEKRATLDRLATTLATACELPVNVGDTAALESIADSVASERDVVSFRVLDDEGRELVAHASPSAGRDAALTAGASVSRISSDLGVVHGEGASGSSGSAGRVELSFSRRSITRAQRSQSRGMLMIGLGIAGLSVALLWPLLSRLTNRLAMLTHSSERISAGDLSGRIADSARDEIGRLARAMEAMRASIAARNDELERMNASLADRVRERTADLEQAQALLEQTGRVARIGGWSLDLDTMHARWSDEVCRIHEVEPGHEPTLDEAIGYYAPEARDTIRQAVTDAVEHGEPYDLELPLVTARGNRLWVRAIGTPEMQNGRCVKLWGAFQDVTAHYEAQDRVRSLARRLETATDGGGIGIWEYIPATGDLVWDRTMDKIYGTEAGAADQMYQRWRQTVHPDDLPEVEAQLRESVSTGQKLETQFRIRRPDGQTRHVQASAIVETDAERGQRRVIGVNSDITELRTVEERLSLAMKASSIGLWDWDVPSGEAYFSDTFYTMIGYEPGELPMCLQTWKTLCHPDDLPGVLEEVGRHFRGETPVFRREHRLQRRDGSWHWILDVGEVVEWNDDGSPRRMLGVHIGIEDQRRAREAAEAANRSKSEFLANMSHEIRTPMTAILGYVDLLGEDEEVTADPERIFEVVETIRTNANHLLTIINDILDMSKIEAGKMTIERVETSPARIVEEVASLMRPRAAEKGIDLMVRYDTPIPVSIESDPTRLRQILLNLAGNAVKFTREGSVTLRVASDPNDRLLRLSVVDTGIGMTKEQRDLVASFDAFTQADGSMTRKFGGTGIGLRISNSLAQMLGGRIEIDSEPGGGSTFTVTVGSGDLAGVELLSPDQIPSLPEMLRDARHGLGPDHMRDDAGQHPGGAAGELAGDLTGLRVLLAEDGPDNQRLISLHLRKAGAEVSLAENGRAALEQAEAARDADQPFDLILMDMQMPELDGYGATRALRAGGIRTPIAALTAHAMDGDRHKCIEAGCDAYLSKPIDRPRLLAMCVALAGRGADGAGSSAA